MTLPEAEKLRLRVRKLEAKLPKLSPIERLEAEDEILSIQEALEAFDRRTNQQNDGHGKTLNNS